MKTLNLYLVSDSTAGTVSAIGRAVVAQFDGVAVRENVWALLRTPKQLERFAETLSQKPGPVLYTMVDEALSENLQRICARLSVPCIHPLERVAAGLSSFLQQDIGTKVGSRHALDEGYFSRIEAIDYTLAHDDGKAHWELAAADIILVGPSRTSKSPTCVYLAYSGIRAANVPFVNGVELPTELFAVTQKTLVVGLLIQPQRLVEIRKSRLQSISQEDLQHYADDVQVEDEIKAARNLYRKQNWPIIDVSRRSVEETAAAILNIYHRRREETLS